MIELPVVNPDGAETPGSGKRLWRSTADLRRDPEWVKLAHDEFMPGVAEPPSGTSRRQFLQIMGASMALAGLTACRRPVEKILPTCASPKRSFRAFRSTTPRPCPSGAACGRCWSKATRAPDQDRGQPGSSAQPGCDGRLRAGFAAESVRSGPLAAGAPQG